jgi:hypothetical protein
VVDSRSQKAPLLNGGSMWFKWSYGNVGIIGDRAGQLGESGEYWMGRLRVVWIINMELQGGTPRLC